MTKPGKKLLSVRDLKVEFETARGTIAAVDRLSFDIDSGETLGIVGESGSGKSVTSLALLGLLPVNARVSGREISFLGEDLLKASERRREQIRGAEIAMIFQDPMTSLNPSFTIEFQIAEALKAHSEAGKERLRERVVELLRKVGIPDPQSRLGAFPHQLSGGMSQRVMIAMMIACEPKLLIADEPTTALDVTIQAQILRLLADLQRERGMGLILITHDIGVVAEYASRVMVMYAGQEVESGATRAVIESPKHPYTSGLLASLPGRQEAFRARLPSLAGMVPDLTNRPPGCQFAPRCGNGKTNCGVAEPEVSELVGRRVKCFYPLQEGLGARA
jgi:dipeptide transport system ATP-binding protein